MAAAAAAAAASAAAAATIAVAAIAAAAAPPGEAILTRTNATGAGAGVEGAYEAEMRRMHTKRRRWRRSPHAAIERLPLSPAARLTGAASESASSARAIRFLLAFSGTPYCGLSMCDFGPGVVRLCEHNPYALFTQGLSQSTTVYSGEE